MIRLGTLFSGIGVIEQALKKMKLPHRNVFACDNGEREIFFLPLEIQKEYAALKKIPKNQITPRQQLRLKQYSIKEKRLISSVVKHVYTLASKEEKKKYVDDLYKQKTTEPNLVQETYLANYKLDISDFHQDIRFLDGRDYVGEVDLMVGGSPCQSFSSNGKRGGFADTRGTLFHEYARIINEVKPKCFIFENVRGMLVHDEGKTWEVIKNTFRKLNYKIYLRHNADGIEDPLLNALEFGVPQNRLRIFLVGIRSDIPLKTEFVFPRPMSLCKTNKDYLDNKVLPKYYLGEKGFLFVTTHPTRAQVGKMIQKCQKANQQFNWNGDFIFEKYEPKKHSAEILKKGFLGMWNGEQGLIRQYTPRECLRLMGFPDTFVMPHKDTVMWRQSGNSIVVNVLEEIVKELIKTGVFE